MFSMQTHTRTRAHPPTYLFRLRTRHSYNQNKVPVYKKKYITTLKFIQIICRISDFTNMLFLCVRCCFHYTPIFICKRHFVIHRPAASAPPKALKAARNTHTQKKNKFEDTHFISISLWFLCVPTCKDLNLYIYACVFVCMPIPHRDFC